MSARGCEGSQGEHRMPLALCTIRLQMYLDRVQASEADPEAFEEPLEWGNFQVFH